MRRFGLGLVCAALLGAAGLVWWIGFGDARSSWGAREHREVRDDGSGSRTTRDLPEKEPGPEGGPEAEEAAKATVRGRVLAGRKPIEGAFVYLRAEEMSERQDTGADGTFEFAAAAGTFTLGAAHPDYGPVRRSVTMRAGEAIEADLAMEAGLDVEILVLAEAGGGPVADAEVLLLRAGKSEGIEGTNAAIEDVFSAGWDEDQPPDLSFLVAFDFADLMSLFDAEPAVRVAVAPTDGAGRARLRGLPPGTFDALVRHPGFVAHRIRRQPIGPGEIAVRLSAGGRLVVLPPLVGGRVPEGYWCAVQRAGIMPMPVAMKKVGTAGEVVFEHLPPGDFQVSVSRHGGGALFFSGGVTTEVEVEVKEEEEEFEVEAPPPEESALVTRPVTIAAGKTTVLDLRGDKGARLFGRFLAGDEPVGDGIVMLLAGDQQVGQAQVGEDGAFEFEKLAPGTYRLVGASNAGGAARLDVGVPPGRPEVEVTLRLGTGSLGGRVTGPGDEPVQYASVFLEHAAKPWTEPVRSLADLYERLAGQAQSGGDGAYEIRGLEGGTYRVLCGSEGRLEITTAVIPEGGRARVDVQFGSGRQRRLFVKLAGPDGKPVKGQVSVTSEGGTMTELAALADQEEALTGGGKEAHEFALPPGRYRVSASAPDLASVFHREVDLAEDRELDLLLSPGTDVTLRLAGGAAAGKEVEVAADGGYALGVGVSIFEMLLKPRTVRADDEGVVRIPHVGPGRYSVRIDGREVAEVRVGTNPVEKTIRLE